MQMKRRGLFPVQLESMICARTHERFFMRLQHTAAFALTAWSLIMPPTSRTLRLDLTSDLSKWQVHSVHPSEADCEQEKRRLQDDLNAKIAQEPKTNLRRPVRDMLAARYKSSRCVSAADLNQPK